MKLGAERLDEGHFAVQIESFRDCRLRRGLGAPGGCPTRFRRPMWESRRLREAEPSNVEAMKPLVPRRNHGDRVAVTFDTCLEEVVAR